MTDQSNDQSRDAVQSEGADAPQRPSDAQQPNAAQQPSDAQQSGYQPYTGYGQQGGDAYGRGQQGGDASGYGQQGGSPYGYSQQGGSPYGYSQQSYSGYTQSQDGAYTPGYQQPTYQQAYQQPVAPGELMPLYPMTDTDRNLRLVAFVFCVLSLVSAGWLIIPLAWMIPMAVISWGIYKGQKPNTVAFGVCMLIFCSLVAGILLLCSRKDR